MCFKHILFVYIDVLERGYFVMEELNGGRTVQVNPYVIQMDKFVHSLEKLTKVFVQLEKKHDLFTKTEMEEMYEKVHVTPDEIKSWGLSGGKMVQTFDTDCAKIGILICYDVEFPELSRIMADQGMQILFVPFLTDTQNGYSRVRVCAQARAIENECFVAIAGSVGNLPRVHNMDIQYAQSGVFTPCDFAFPTDGKRAEATPNTEMILVSDVDLDLLNELHTYGSVRNLRDRRHDLYELRVKK